MKKLIFTLFLCGLLTNFLKSQDFSLRLFVTDSENRKDSIQFGLKNNATLGVDSLLGEQDIYGQPWDSLDIRIIHRDIAEHHCLRASYFDDPHENIYFDSNADFKIEFRPIGGAFGTIGMNFEILIHSSNPPIFITTDFSEIFGNMLYEGYSSIHLLDDNCDAVITEYIIYDVDNPNDTLFTSNSTLTTIAVQFEHEVSVKLNADKKIIVCPNPAKDEIKVIADIPIIVKMHDIHGKELKVSYTNRINTSDLIKGFYIIHVYNHNGELLKVDKILIE